MQALSAIASTRNRRRPFPTPSALIDNVYYFSIAYTVMADVVGLSIPLVGGGMLLVLAGACVVQLQSRARVVYQPIASLVGCAIVFLVVQIGIHGESLSDGVL